MPNPHNPAPLFQDREWQHSYKTSSLNPDGQPVNILHDFYIPVLKRSISYDRVTPSLPVVLVSPSVMPALPQTAPSRF